MSYRFIRLRDRKIITNDSDAGNTRQFITECFAFCDDDAQRRLSQWFDHPHKHYIRFDFGRESVIVTNPVATRRERQMIQWSRRKFRRLLVTSQSMTAKSMTAYDILTALQQAGPGGYSPQWVKIAALLVRPNKYGRLYDTTTAKFYTEVTVRIPAVKTAKRSGKPYNGLQRRRMDMVALVRPNYRAFEPFIIGIEVKVSESDLLNDAKLTEYLPYCHLFYLAVPQALEEAAARKLSAMQSQAKVAAGLLLVDDSLQVRPRLQPSWVHSPGNRHLSELYAELLLHQFKRD
ncbi:MAG: hypothetical protein Kow0031_40970 [Anaerolineae bacterium]